MNEKLEIGDKVKIKDGEVGILRSLNASVDERGAITESFGTKCCVECEMPPYNFHGKLLRQIKNRVVNRNDIVICE